MRSRTWMGAMALVTAAAVAGCGKSEEQKAAEAAAEAAKQAATTPAPTPQNAAQGMQQLGQAMQQAGQAMQQQGGTVKTVDFEVLEKLVPDVAGWERENTKSQQQNMGFVAISTAGAEYKQGEKEIELDITDTSLSQMMLAPLMMFASSGYSERSSDGYTKAAAVGGHPGFEKWETRNKAGEVTVIVANRFIVQAKGQNVDSIDQVRKVVEAVDLAKLAATK